MSEQHVVLGKGQVGSLLAKLLVEHGHKVRVLSRSGGPDTDGIKHVAVDAGDADALTRASDGADVFYNCANPAGYHLWLDQWPPMSAAILAACKATGAGLVTLGNLYVYGEVDTPMTEDNPLAATGIKGRLRADMWREALELHEAGSIRMTEARASDYYGPGALRDAVMGDRVVPHVIAGKPGMTIGDPHAPHSWTYLPDVARTLARLGSDDRSWGKAWHVPTAPARSQREMARIFAEIAGAPPARARHVPWWMLIRVIGMREPAMRGFTETRHQWDKPYVIDSSRYTAVFGDEPTPVVDAVAETIAWWRSRRS